MLPPWPLIWLVLANERVSRSAPDALPELEDLSLSEVRARGDVIGGNLGVVWPSLGKSVAVRMDVFEGITYFSYEVGEK